MAVLACRRALVAGSTSGIGLAVALVEATIAAFGEVDILVNNAGIQHVAAVDAFPDDTWDQLLAINLSSVFHTTKAALPRMKVQGWGRIVNIASAHG